MRQTRDTIVRDANVDTNLAIVPRAVYLGDIASLVGLRDERARQNLHRRADLPPRRSAMKASGRRARRRSFVAATTTSACSCDLITSFPGVCVATPPPTFNQRCHGGAGAGCVQGWSCIAFRRFHRRRDLYRSADEGALISKWPIAGSSLNSQALTGCRNELEF